VVDHRPHRHDVGRLYIVAAHIVGHQLDHGHHKAGWHKYGLGQGQYKHPERLFARRAGAKFAQALPHESEEWHAVYSTLRNSVEGMNAFIKDGAREAVDDPERRRIRGVAAQSLLVAFLLCAANLRKIDSYLAREEAEASGSVRRLPPRRTTKAIGEFLPEAAGPTSGGRPSPGPDPPLTA